MLTQEDLNSWYEHPVTQEYLARLNHMIQETNRVDDIPLTDLDLVRIGTSTIAKTNYVAALKDAMNVFEVMEVADETED